MDRPCVGRIRPLALQTRKNRSDTRRDNPTDYDFLHFFSFMFIQHAPEQSGPKKKHCSHIH